MPFTLAIDLPNLPDGGALIIDGLGEFTNNETFEISDEDAALYQARKATLDQTYDEEGHMHTSLVDGQSLLETFADHPYIKVTVSTVVAPKVVTPLVVTPPVVTPPIDDSGKVGE